MEQLTTTIQQSWQDSLVAEPVLLLLPPSRSLPYSFDHACTIVPSIVLATGHSFQANLHYTKTPGEEAKYVPSPVSLGCLLELSLGKF